MQMLVQSYRPKKFSDVIGQQRAVNIFKGIIKSNLIPKSIILFGPYGTGKTTLARIFGRALFCTSYKNDVCGVCPTCSDILSARNRYFEYDSSVIGNVESIKDLFILFEMVLNEKRLFVFDEIHLASSKSQSMFLKVLEDFDNNNYFVFCTTNLESIYKPLISRSLLIELNLVENEVIKNHLLDIAKKENFDVSESVIDKIVLRSAGHVRDAVNFLQLYFISKSEESFQAPTDDILRYFKYVFSGEREKAVECIDVIIKNPISLIHKSFNFVVLSLVKSYVIQTGSDEYKMLASFLRANVFKLFKLSSEVWVQNSFKDEYLTVSLFYSLIDIINPQKS